MVLPTAGVRLSWANLRAEFGGGTSQLLLSQLYRDAPQGLAADNPNIPAKGTTLKLSNFYGTKSTYNQKYQPRLWFKANAISGLTNGSQITTWPGSAGGVNGTAYEAGSGGAGKPKIITNDGAPYVRFGHPNDINLTAAGSLLTNTTVGNYISLGGGQTFNLSTNGGATLLAVVRFRNVTSQEHIFDFGNGTGVDNLAWFRSLATNTNSFTSMNGAVSYTVDQPNTISNNTWMVILAKIRPGAVDLWKDDTKSTITNTFSIFDKTFSNMYIAKSGWATDNYATIDLREFIMYDKLLSDTEALTIRRYALTSNNTMFSPRIWLQVDTLTSIAKDTEVGIWAGANGTTMNATGIGRNFTAPIMKRDESFPYIRMGAGATNSDTYGNYFDLGSSNSFSFGSNGFTMACVCRFWSSTALNYEYLVDFRDNTNSVFILIYRDVATPNFVMGVQQVSGATTPTYPSPANTWVVNIFRWQGTAASHWNSSDTESTVAAPSLTNKTFNGGMRIGKPNTSYHSSNLDISEFIMWERAFTNEEILAVKYWLKNKYGL